MKLRFSNGPAPQLSRGGFTMIEIAIALGVIGFALVAIMGILPLGLNVQRDNRFETIINQDATYWLEAIRNGAQDASYYEDDLTNYVQQIKIFIPSGGNTNTQVFTLGAGGLGAGQFNSTSNIISILTNPYTNANNSTGPIIAEADVHAISGSIGEKGSDVSFAYRMEVSLFQPDSVNTPTLWDLSLTMRWPVVKVGGKTPVRKPLRYRTMISRNVMTTTVGSGPSAVEYYQFTP